MLTNKLSSILELPVRVLGPLHDRTFINIEGLKNMDFKLNRRSSRPGVSCLLRIKNEAGIIENTLQSINAVFDEIIIVDNGSIDSTLDIVKRIATTNKKISVYSYDFQVARCGTDHNNTLENSVHNLAYYYNWALSKCNCAYVVKWDADMILSASDAEWFKNKLWSYSIYWPTFTEIQIQTVYLHDGVYWRALNEINSESRIFPNRSDVFFVKGKNFEILQGKRYATDQITLNFCKVFELKETAKNEFSHWSTIDFPTQRKKIEYENWTSLRSGNIDPATFHRLGNVLAY